MIDDGPLLRQATSAFRQHTHEPPGEAGLERFERALSERAPARRRRSGWFLVPIAAALLAGSAVAASSGVLSRWLAASDMLVPAPSSTPIVRAEPPAPRPTAAEVVEPIASAPPVASSFAARPRAVPSAPVVAEPVDLDALYRTAHDAQFKAHDPNRALGAYDRYLRHADPSARLLLEARYNRGLVLLELGRKAEARAALQPFADGDYGNYRQAEASKLLESK